MNKEPQVGLSKGEGIADGRYERSRGDIGTRRVKCWLGAQSRRE